MATVHNFKTSLAESHLNDELPLWVDCYKSFFGDDFVAAHSVRDDGEHQRAGIDRVIVLKSGKSVTVDEKFRGRNKKTGKVYDDIALEYKHVYKNGTITRGWILKPLLCDYIAYAIGPLGVCYLLPTIHLQTAYRRNEHLWLSTKRIIEAENQGYTSYSVILPVKEVFAAIGKALRSYFPAVEVSE